MSDKMYYSAKNNGFYPESLKASYEASKDGWPDDATEISQEAYQALLDGQRSGQTISPGKDGKPKLITPVIDYRQTAEIKREELLTKTGEKTADWRTELQLDTITDGDKARLSGMTNISELLINIVTNNRPKMLKGLNQKVCGKALN